jgi:hypothetical protein
MTANVPLRLLYLIFNRLPGWLSLLNRTSASQDDELPVLRHDVTLLHPTKPKPHLGLGRPSRAHRADPTPTRDAARSPPRHPDHRLTVTPPPDGQKPDPPEPLRAPTPR